MSPQGFSYRKYLRIGSNIDGFLKKEGIFEEAQALAVKQV